MNKNLREPAQNSADFLEPILPKTKRDAIGRDAKWASIGIALVSFLGQQFVLNTETVKTLYAPIENYLSPGVASIDDYITIWTTFIASAPLVIAFAIIWGYAAARLKKQEGFAAGHYWVAALLLWFAAQVGNTLGFAPVKAALPRGGTPMAWLAFAFADYMNAYGFVLFVSSLIVGVFVSRAWNTLTASS